MNALNVNKMEKTFSNYQVARMELIRTSKRAKRIYAHDKPAVRQIINDRVDSLSREYNLTEHKRDLLANYACKLHPKDGK